MQSGYETVNIGKSHTPLHSTWNISKQEDGGFDKRYADFCQLGVGYDEKKYHVVKRPGLHQVIIGGTFPVFWNNPTMVLTNDAMDFLAKRNSEKPFLLRVSYNWPHTPVLPPPPFDHLYSKSEIPIQRYDSHAVQKRAIYDQTLAKAQRMSELSEQEYDQIWKDYMGLVGYVDYEIGRLLAGIKALGLEDNLIIFFSSDHGRALGEFGHGEKCTFDKQVWQVPFIWHWPGHLPEGEICEDLCELIDTGRTLLSLIGLEQHIPPEWRGRSLFNKDPKGSQYVFGQIGWPNRNAPLLRAERVKKIRYDLEEVMGMSLEDAYPIFGYMRVAIRTEKYRMDLKWMEDGKRVPLESADGNLFDLQKDPREKDNLWNKTQYVATINDLNRQIEHWFEKLDKPELVFG